MGILIPLLLISFCCLVIWKAGDAFVTASEFVGRNLSDGVRGATINAVASSMPEVFTSLFFLFILKDASGFSGGIGTTAGSAIFNSMVIPAVSIIAVISVGIVREIKVSRKVMMRDGIALIITEMIFLILISGNRLDWYHGFILMMVYVMYITYMISGMIRKQKKDEFQKESAESEIFHDEERQNISLLKAILTLDLERIFLGKGRINAFSAWSLLIFATLSIAFVCYFLVVACEWLGEDQYHVPYLGTFDGLGIPVMFVALILAAAASSFPDTVISIKDAQKGKYDDAISNALGSNIFDVCFALGFPLFIFTLTFGPLYMPPEIVDLSTELRFLLLLITAVAVFIFTSSKTMGSIKAYTLLGIYVLFVIYIIGRGTDNAVAGYIADKLLTAVRIFRIQ
ncbi:MAG TPA: sodium:calcium antiporter [Cyclobacteriaceae bacterium]